ncbi:Nucleoporin GLE1 [Pichia kudriavzevii]|uniref:mRNA export factor GLE1 n=1 Tax=Pichia kudriavzevii TaxID=4909 RepID=A0A1V2LJA2_PICKU|nr:Nucleoporin GLE1 [Pichia kudriavzevii]
MRFVPHRNPGFQTADIYDDTFTDFSSDYDSDDGFNTELEDTEGNILHSDVTLPLEELEQLPEFLSEQGLNKRFDLACKLADHKELIPIRQYSPNLKPSSRLPTSESAQTQVERNRDDNLESYFVSRFTEEKLKRKQKLDFLIKEEEERKRKIEEERRRKEEEERRRTEAEARRIKEEAEKKAREEAERKRREEEEKRKALEEEKRRVERLEKARREQEEALKKQKEAEHEAKRKLDAARKEEEEKKALEEAKNSIVKPSEIEKLYMKYMDNIKVIEETILNPVREDKELKKVVGTHKRKINPKFGQLTNSQQQYFRLVTEIRDLILQTQSNELAYKWILNFVSDAIISQAETEVSVKPKSSLPLAKLTLNLMLLFPALRHYMLCKFYRSCPMLIGYSCSEDTEEGRGRMGWMRDEDTGKWENEVQHNERLSGISTLYSVITRLKVDQSYLGYDPSSMKHPLPISHSWIFLARMVDTPSALVTETHFVIVGSWWDACSREFLQAYGRQSAKLLRLIVEKWTRINGKSSAGRVRLQLLGEEWSKGVVKSFPEMEM